MLLSIRTCTHTYIVTHLIKNWVDICECGYNSEPTELTISASLHTYMWVLWPNSSMGNVVVVYSSSCRCLYFTCYVYTLWQ